MKEQSKHKIAQNSTDDNLGVSQDIVLFLSSTDRILHIFALVAKQKYFIVKNMIVLMIAFAIVLMLIPARFESTALVGIFPPQFSSEVQTKPLTVMTAKEILRAPELIQKIIVNITNGHKVMKELVMRKPVDVACSFIKGSSEEEIINEVEFCSKETVKYLKSLSVEDLRALLIWKDDELANLTVDNLRRKLDCEEIEEKKTAIDIVYSPLIRLFAVSNSGQKAMLLVNTWSFLFEEKYVELTNEKQDTIVKYLEGQQSQSETELEDIETSIVKLKAKHNVELYKSQITAYNTTAQQWTEQLLQKRNLLFTIARDIENSLRLKASLMSDDKYVGAIDPIEWVKPQTSEGLSMKLPRDVGKNREFPLFNNPEENERFVLPADKMLEDSLALDSQNGFGNVSFDLIQQQIIYARENREKNLEMIQDFERQYPIEMMEMDLNARQKEVLDLRQQRASETVKLASALETRKNVEDSLKNTSQTLFFQKNIPAETVATLIAQKSPKALADMGNLYDETFNPNWQSLNDRYNDLTKQIEQYTNNIAEIDKVLPEKEHFQADLGVTIRKARELNKIFGENLDKWNSLSDRYYTEYIRTNERISSLSHEMILIRSQIDQIMKDRDMAIQMGHKTQQELNEAEMQLSLLNTKKSALQNKADLLLNKYHQAQIASRNNVNDIGFAARAVAPIEHFFPPRSVLFVCFSVFSFVILCFIALKRQLRKRNDSDEGLLEPASK